MAQVQESVRRYQRVIIGIDPGTAVMGYGVIGVLPGAKEPVMEAMGVLRLAKLETHYMRLRRIYDRVLSLVEQYLPDEMAIEAPFFGKNVQTTLKLGRAQGVAIAAALARQVPISEYEPATIKKAITGLGSASKEQVREMLRRTLRIPDSSLLPELDATDALAVAVCHYYETLKPAGARLTALGSRPRAASAKSWSSFASQNPDRVIE